MRATFLPVVAGIAVLGLAGCEWNNPFVPEQPSLLPVGIPQARYAPTPTEPLSLEKAIALALDYNLENIARDMEIQIQKEMATGAKLKMLPTDTIKGERTRRSNEKASSSESFKTKQESLEASVSSERVGKTYDLGMAWNLLDFGLSCLRAHQAEAEVKIQEMQALRMRQRLALDVTEAYWRAVVAKLAVEDSRNLLDKVMHRRGKIQEQIKAVTISEMDGLEKDKNLARLQQRLREYERGYAKACVNLSGIIGFAPGTPFEVAVPVTDKFEPLPTVDMKSLEEQALQSRVELVELGHREQIQQQEVRAAILKMFPNVNMFGTRKHEDNRFLKHQTWHDIGINTTWSVLSLPQRWKERNIGIQRVEQAKMRRMALAVGILTQVHLAALELEESESQCRDYQELDSIQSRLLTATLKHQKEQNVDESKVLETEVQAFFEHAQYLTAYAKYKVSAARLDNTLGLPKVDLPQPAPVKRKFLNWQLPRRQDKSQGTVSGETVPLPDLSFDDEPVAQAE